jgi:hypothetical protein
MYREADRPGAYLVTTSTCTNNGSRVALHAAPLTSATAESAAGSVPMTPQVARVNQQAAHAAREVQANLITIPPGIFPGMQFWVAVSSKSASSSPQQRFVVTCPENAHPGQKVRVLTPPEMTDEGSEQVFEVVVPPHASPGEPSDLMGNRQLVLVAPSRPAWRSTSTHLTYDDSNGWCRITRATDLKFVWVKNRDNEEKSEVTRQPKKLSPERVFDEEAKFDFNGETKFDFDRAAYVRELRFLEGNDARMRAGTLSLVPVVDQAGVDSHIRASPDNLITITQGKTLDEKISRFHHVCGSLTTPMKDGYVNLVLRREYLLFDAVGAVMSLSREDMRKHWKVEFIGEPDIDGSVSREWFGLVTQQLFDPDFGLWVPSIDNPMLFDINPASGTSECYYF